MQVHRPSRGGQQPKNRKRQQHIAPEGGTCGGYIRPEAARHPEQILRKHKAQYADVEVARIPRRTRLRFRIGKSANGAEGEPYHHAAPDQVGENVPEGAVERQQRKAECRRKPCPAAAETAFLRCGERRLQNAQENYARHPAELRHIKDARRGIEQQQIQRPVECAESKAAVEAQQQEIRLPSAFPVGDTRKKRADERDQQFQQVLNQLHVSPRFLYEYPKKHKASGEVGREKQQKNGNDFSLITA